MLELEAELLRMVPFPLLMTILVTIIVFLVACLPHR